MSNQDIFKGFGSNWKWASMSPKGYARVHTEEPRNESGGLRYSPSKATTERCAAFDANALLVDFVGSVWERTDFTNGPDCETDRFGAALYTDSGEAMQPPTAGPCHYLGCLSPRLMGSIACAAHDAPALAVPILPAAAVEPTQRQHDYLTRCPGTSKEVCEAHACGCEPEPVDTSDEMRDLELDADRKPLSDAKARAWYLVIEGHLTTLQYMAIFGEIAE